MTPLEALRAKTTQSDTTKSNLTPLETLRLNKTTKASSTVTPLQKYRQENPKTPTLVSKVGNVMKELAKAVVEPVATMTARPIQLGAELLGASDESVNEFTKKYFSDWVAPTPQNAKDVYKDVGRGIQTVLTGGLGTTAKSALGLATKKGATTGLGKLSTTGAIEGAGFGLGASMEQGNDILSKDTAKSVALGTGVGAVLPVAFKGLGKVIQGAEKPIIKDTIQAVDNTKPPVTETGIKPTETVTTQPTYYRGGGELDISKVTDEGISISKSKNIASSYGKVSEFNISKDAKIPNERDIEIVAQKLFPTDNPKLSVELLKMNTGFTNNPKILNAFKEAGFDAIDYSIIDPFFDQAEIRILNPKILQPKSQLTEQVDGFVKSQTQPQTVNTSKESIRSNTVEQLKRDSNYESVSQEERQYLESNFEQYTKEIESKDFNYQRDVALGRIQPEPNTAPATAYRAYMENFANDMALKGDDSLQRELSKTNVVRSEAGAVLNALKITDKNNPTAMLSDIRQEVYKKIPYSDTKLNNIYETIKSKINDIKLDDIKITKQIVKDILEELKC